ncbi:MAG: hypothetical protein JXR83_05125 [Deltaproteobacteria bacterium]|nr:hypothetical protein [Deltaproteobacteria bacterium]
MTAGAAIPLARGLRLALAAMLCVAAATSQSCRCDDDAVAAAMNLPESSGACAFESDTVLADHAVGPSWIHWTSACLPGARVVYVDRDQWNIWVMGDSGEEPRCLTCYGDNALGVNFPLDDDGQPPDVHWKGDPEAHPTEPIILFKAENEHSDHRALTNAPSIGWDNDIWALNVCTRQYLRLTALAAGEGVQHSAISEDGRWYVYPRRRQAPVATSDFDFASMVFGGLAVDSGGALHFEQRFAVEPNGEMYYEPNDIHGDGSGRYSLYYTAGADKMLDPYRYDWCEAGECAATNRRLLETAAVHEEFTMVSPSAHKLVWMRGPLQGLAYHADLFISSLDLTGIERVTWYNDCDHWPDRCQAHGAQLSRLEWKADGTAVYYGLWEHGALGPFENVRLHRLDFAGACGQ